MEEFISYEEFLRILNKRITSSGNETYDLLVKVIQHPERYTGIFRLSNAKSKLVQNITQSREIKMGDFIEELLTEYIKILGYQTLDKKIDSSKLHVDQLFKSGDKIYFIEQKMRDDHDSNKKRGDYDKFIKKEEVLKKMYPNNDVYGIMWFVDPSFTKNKKYYEKKLLKDNNDKMMLFYGEELFEYFGNIEIWQELVSHLKRRREENSEKVIQIPDFDTSEEVYLALAKLPNNLWKRLNSSEERFVLLRRELFPTGYNIERASKTRETLNKDK